MGAGMLLLFAGDARAQTAQAAPAPAKKPEAAKPAGSPAKTAPKPAAVQPPAAQAGITQEQASAILLELRQIRILLERQLAQTAAAARPPEPPPPPERATVGLGDELSLGAANAPVTMIEFTDLQCTFCKRFHDTTFAEIKKNYIDTGKVRFIHRDLPLDFHEHAVRAAIGARCAGEQGKFWPMRDALISQANALSPEVIVGTARKLGVNMDAYQACVDSGKYKAPVERDLNDALKLEVDGTPTFFIGKSAKGAIEGKRVVGAHPYPVFERAIQEAMPK